MKSNIITLKISYIPENGDLTDIFVYIKNYNNVLKFTYNRVQKNIKSTKELTKLQNNLNNIFVDSHFKNSAIYEAKAFQDSKLIFGGKKLFLERLKNKISKEEFKQKRLLPICSIGEANKKANRKFKIIDENTIIFKPNKDLHIKLNLINQGKNYKKVLNKLINLQETKQIAITYKLDLNYIYLSFDNSILEQNNYKTKKDRIIAIDMNPNYLSYSITDWKDENSYIIIDKGVFDISLINQKENSLNISSNDFKKKYIKNKRDYELTKIAYRLFNLCKHYQCECFSSEYLSIKSKDLNKGKQLNKLVNNQWNRNKFVNTLKKLVNSSSATFIEVKPEYSSILGNLIYREEQLPDMVLSSIEIGRRAYEFNNQYLLKYKIQQKNVVFPKLEFVKNRIEQSLEELGHPIKFETYQELFSRLKKSKLKYRFLLEQCKNSRVFSNFSYKSLVKLYKFN